MAQFEMTTGELFEHFQSQIDEIKRTLTRTPGSTELKEAFARLTTAVTGGDRQSGMALSAGWNTYASVDLTTPSDKSTVTILAIGTAAALDRTSGGLTSVSGRVRIAGSVGPAAPSAKDAGASMVDNIITAAHTHSISDVSGVIQVRFDLNPLAVTPFSASPSNTASLAVFAVFGN